MAGQPSDSGSASAAQLAERIVEVLAGTHGGRAAVATVIDRTGSAPQVIGAKLIVCGDGTQLGTVGGGAVEAQVIAACQQALRRGRCERLRANLVRDLGMCCGGTMEVFVEYVQRQARLFIVGAGHVAQALAPMAAAADFDVAVFDDREQMLANPAFSQVRVDARDVDELEPALSGLTESDFVVIVTRDHARDERILASALDRPHRYLGMIGSRRKVLAVIRRILHRRRQMGLAPPDLSRVHAPIGLDLGGRTPGEIAVSVVAELVARRHGGSGRSLTIANAIEIDADT